MKFQSRSGARLAAVVGVMVTISFSSMVWAGPQEDYEEGQKRVQRGDIVGAMAPLKKSAEGGHAKGQALYAYILKWSDFLDDAAKWYRKSAEAGEPDGEYGLGTMYMVGEGVERDTAEATRWFEKAAAKKHEGAIRSLATGVANGTIKIDEAKQADAVTWLRAAADLGAIDATEALAKAYLNGRWGLPTDKKLAEEYQSKAFNLRSAKQKPASGAKK